MRFKIIVVLIFLITAASFGVAKGELQKLRFSLWGCVGYAYLSMRDFDISGETAIFEALKDVDKVANVKKLHSSLGSDFEGRIGYMLPWEHLVELGIGIGRLYGGDYEQIETDIKDNEVENLTIGASARIYPVTLWYGLPLAEYNLNFYFGSGIDSYSVTLDYDKTKTKPDEPTKFNRGELTDAGVGGHLVFGVRYFVRKNLSLCFNIGAGFISLNEFIGILMEEDGTGEEKILIMKKDLDTGREEIRLKPTHVPLSTNEREANVDLSGMRINIWLGYHF